MFNRKLLLICLLGAAAIAGCRTDPLKETPEQLQGEIAIAAQNQAIAGGKYVECALGFAEQKRNSTAGADSVADAAAASCHKIASDYGIYRNQVEVFTLAQKRTAMSPEAISQAAAGIPAAERYAREFIAEQRPAVIAYILRSRPQPKA